MNSTIYGLHNDTGLDIPYIQRVIKKMNVAQVGVSARGAAEYDVAEFTSALEKYRNNKITHREDKEEVAVCQNSLEEERLTEIIRGLKLKNDELERKLVATEDVKTYLLEYRSYLLTQLKDVLTTRYPNQGDGQKAVKLRSLGVGFFNSLVETMNQYTNKWIRSYNLKGEVKESNDWII